MRTYLEKAPAGCARKIDGLYLQRLHRRGSSYYVSVVLAMHNAVAKDTGVMDNRREDAVVAEHQTHEQVQIRVRKSTQVGEDSVEGRGAGAFCQSERYPKFMLMKGRVLVAVLLTAGDVWLGRRRTQRSILRPPS